MTKREFPYDEPLIYEREGEGWNVRCICGAVLFITEDGNRRCPDCGSLIALEVQIDVRVEEVGIPPK